MRKVIDYLILRLWPRRWCELHPMTEQEALDLIRYMMRVFKEVC